MMELIEQEITITKNTSLFRGLHSDEIQEIVKSARVREVGNGDYFFIEGDPAGTAYVLLKGKVKLSQVTIDGQQVLLGYLGPGRAFGIIALLKKVTYPVSAQGIGECRALAWDQNMLNTLMARFPRIALNSMYIMAGQIREFQNRVRDLSTKRVETRIARAVLRLARQTGKKVEAGVLIDLPLSRQDLAEMTGTTHYTVSRILNDWEKQEIIRSKRKQIVICYPHGLVKIAEDLPQSDEQDPASMPEDLCDF